METNLFEIATRKAFRFPSPAGMLSVEDLWNTQLTATKVNIPNLNNIAQAINAELGKVDGVVDFVNPAASKGSTIAAELGQKLEVVKHIIAYKVDIQARADKAAETRANNDRIKELIAKKKDDKLADLSIEELTKLLS